MIRNQKIGFVFQSFNLLARTPAIEQVIMPLTYTNATLSSREAYQRAIKLTAQTPARRFLEKRLAALPD